MPRDGYEFQKIAVLDGNKIEFTTPDGELYEWSSGVSILPEDGTWNLWVLHDPEYTPFFGGENNLPKAAKRSNVLDKIDDVLTRGGVSLTFPAQTKGSSKKDPVVVPQRVIIGGADSMQNLLPKSP